MKFDVKFNASLEENFEVNFELGYMVNFFDHDTWKKSKGGMAGDTYENRDAWKAQVIFAYSF